MVSFLPKTDSALALAGADDDEPNDMQLTDEQKQQVIRWIAEGNKLADVQRRLADEFNVRLTYMEARLLIDDLQLTPQDPPEPVKSPVTAETPAPAATGAVVADPAAPLSPMGKLVLKVDEITKPGTIVSGTVTFSDGGKAAWYLDQTGRLGMNPETPGYRPPEPDVEEFQITLERELARLGM
ncbi:MAG: hypothetical protein ABIZ56_02135 [Chthoniobacteraceae bacterium]